MIIWAPAESLETLNLVPSLHCQQKRQQRCWKGAGSGSRGVVLDSSAKWGSFSAETTLEATDSDPPSKLQPLWLSSREEGVQVAHRSFSSA